VYRLLPPAAAPPSALTQMWAQGTGNGVEGGITVLPGSGLIAGCSYSPTNQAWARNPATGVTTGAAWAAALDGGCASTPRIGNDGGVLITSAAGG
jgi:hypothetical protein